jgi:glyoxylase-like metal-dependent hydrolase (beta-lactamase superfamily II)
LKFLAPGVWRLKEFPAPSINVYLAEDVLIDAGRRWDRRRIFAELEGREISMLALTHAHPDHQGVAKDVCEARAMPLACHADDAEAMEGKRPMQEAAAGNPVNRVIRAIGHARGEVIFFRDSDRVAICGDVIRNMSYATALPGIKEPPSIFTYDPAENRRSIRKLAELNPSLILPGHGPAVTDIAGFERFVAALPAEA